MVDPFLIQSAWQAELLRLCKLDCTLNRDPTESECEDLFRDGHTPTQAHEVFAKQDEDEGTWDFE